MSALRMSVDVISTSEIDTPGFSQTNDVDKSEDIDVAEGITPKRSRPLSEVERKRNSCLSVSSSASTRRAHFSTISPSWVKPRKRLPRSTMATPSSLSSCLSASDKAGCEISQRSAAFAKYFSCASATKYSSWRINKGTSRATPIFNAGADDVAPQEVLGPFRIIPGVTRSRPTNGSGRTWTQPFSKARRLSGYPRQPGFAQTYLPLDSHGAYGLRHELFTRTSQTGVNNRGALRRQIAVECFVQRFSLGRSVCTAV
jgi:hypothetical protein